MFFTVFYIISQHILTSEPQWYKCFSEKTDESDSTWLVLSDLSQTVLFQIAQVPFWQAWQCLLQPLCQSYSLDSGASQRAQKLNRESRDAIWCPEISLPLEDTFLTDWHFPNGTDEGGQWGSDWINGPAQISDTSRKSVHDHEAKADCCFTLPIRPPTTGPWLLNINRDECCLSTLKCQCKMPLVCCVWISILHTSMQMCVQFHILLWYTLPFKNNC